MWIPRKNAHDPLKIVAFDFDGTLIRGRGFKYSWQLVWNYLKYDNCTRIKYFKKYIDSPMAQDDYKTWCEDCIYYFKQKELARNDFEHIAKKVKVVKNLTSAIELLKHHGMVVGIISGGIDSLLEEMIPDCDELFDFIYINRFIYDADGVLESIVPTLYDFDRKLYGLRCECNKLNVGLDATAFVGEGRNDEDIIKKVSGAGGCTIGFPPNTGEIEVRAHKLINGTDLIKVAESVLAFDK